MKKTFASGLAATAAILLGMAAPAGADTLYSFNWDGAGSVAEAFTPISLTIGYGVYAPSLDGFGDPIPGSDHWSLDASGGSVPVIDPSSVGWGAAPSLSKALDARDGTVVMVFDTPLSIAGFSATLDNSTRGNLFDSPILFYGASNNLLGSISVDQTVPGTVTSIGSLAAVKTVVLPAGAFYDNVVITAVPEPGTWAILPAAAALLVWRRMRRTA